MNKAIRTIKIFFNRQFLFTLIVFLAFVLTTVFTSENSNFPGGINFIYFLVFVSYFMSLNYTAKSVEAPEGLIYFLNAGFNKTEIAIYFGLNFLISATIIILFLFPIKTMDDFFLFLSTLLFCLLTEFVWLTFGIYYLNILILIPLTFTMATGLLQTLFHIDAFTLISNLIYIKISFIVLIGIFLILSIFVTLKGI